LIQIINSERPNETGSIIKFKFSVNKREVASRQCELRKAAISGFPYLLPKIRKFVFNMFNIRYLDIFSISSSSDAGLQRAEF
tara:strand:+ start:14322 stop:14567 length:246 start_codon:yes stop_codon:yes gene_type:complete